MKEIPQRKVAACISCGEERELAAHGLCFMCYRRKTREEENPWAAADKHNRAKLKAQRKLRTAVNSILNAVDSAIELLEEEHVATVRSICGHYLAGFASGLTPPPIPSMSTVNSEHDDAVHSSQRRNSQSCSAPMCDEAETVGLVRGKSYAVKAIQDGGFGVYELGRDVCLLRFEDEDDAWAAIEEVTEVPDDLDVDS